MEPPSAKFPFQLELYELLAALECLSTLSSAFLPALFANVNNFGTAPAAEVATTELKPNIFLLNLSDNVSMKDAESISKDRGCCKALGNS